MGWNKPNSRQRRVKRRIQLLHNAGKLQRNVKGVLKDLRGTLSKSSGTLSKTKGIFHRPIGMKQEFMKTEDTEDADNFIWEDADVKSEDCEVHSVESDDEDIDSHDWPPNAIGAEPTHSSSFMKTLSLRMAILLRYWAFADGVMVEDDWVPLSYVLRHLDCTEAAVHKAVRSSIRNEALGAQPRFAMWISGRHTWLKAIDWDYYRQRAQHLLALDGA